MPTTATQVRPRSEVEADIEENLGIVPSFFAEIPDALLDHEWELFKYFELTETQIPHKYKELIGLAVHAETKCRYCTLYHMESARLHGATEEEIQEACHYSKYTVGWSAYVNGMQLDYDRFEDETKQILDFAREQVSGDGEVKPRGRKGKRR